MSTFIINFQESEFTFQGKKMLMLGFNILYFITFLILYSDNKKFGRASLSVEANRKS